MDLFDQGERAVQRNRLYGVYPALVADINDPDGQGRVKIRLPWLPDDGGGCVMDRRSAARPKCCSSATATRYCRSRMFTPLPGSLQVTDKGGEDLSLIHISEPTRPY